MNVSDKSVDVVVVGLGAFGSSIAWRLAARGISVFGAEQHTISNSFGSSHGLTRNFRSISQNHTLLYPLALLSRELWFELEGNSSNTLLTQTNALIMGQKDKGLIASALAVVAKYGINPRVLEAADIRRQYPIFGNITDEDIAIVDELGGMLFPEKCVTAAANAATRHGADLQENVEVFGHSLDGSGLVVQTSNGDIRANQIVYATGAWTAELLPRLKLKSLRIPQCWFTYQHDSDATPSLADLPPFQRDLGNVGRLWGHGAAQLGGLTKLGTHGDPTRDRNVYTNNIDRAVHSEDVAHLSKNVAHSFPNVNPVPAKSKICLLTESVDNQFVLGPVGDPRVFVASGGSGQGFKHATGVGEIVADMCQGIKSSIDTGFMHAQRMIEPPNGAAVAQRRD